MAIKVLVVMPAGPPEEYDAITSAGHEVAFGSPPGNRFLRLSDDELIALAADASCVVYNFCSRHVMESLPRLATVVSPYVGYDKIDVEAATELGILACNNLTPESLTSTAEGAVGLILSLAKGISRGEARLRRGGWQDSIERGVLMQGSTVGIVGLGRIGGNVARRLAGWDVRLLGHTRSPQPERLAALDVQPVDLPTLLRESDFVTLHAPLTLETEGMIGKAELRSMKPTAYLVNTARGALVDEAALCRAIGEGWIAGAALDVFVDEPLPADSPLRALDPERVLLSPHGVASTRVARQSSKRRIIDSVLAALAGELPESALNPEVLPRWRGRASG